jgi:CDP-diglyceride synthetase
MGCVFALLSALSPRLALVLIWIATNLVDRAFTTFLLPLLGLIFLPFTTLLYVLAYRPVTGVSGWGWFSVAVGFLLDLGAYGGGERGRHARRR